MLTSRFATTHRRQTGRPSSHLIRRARHPRHPVLERVYFCLRLTPRRPLLIGRGGSTAFEWLGLDNSPSARWRTASEDSGDMYGWWRAA